MAVTSRSILNFPLELNQKTILIVLYAMFFLSGCAALIYQVMWQRMLFVIFGVDLTSITIIVSVFMFGLGVGGLWGGYVADKHPTILLTYYLVIELLVALFGFLSPTLINVLGNQFFTNNFYLTAFTSYTLLAFPTLLMGATFPILVTHINHYYHNVGRSVGNLYFANTLGGAMGAYLSGFILLYQLDITGSINRAAFLNLAIAFTAYVFFRKAK